MGNNETIIAERIKKEMVLTDDEIAARKAENIEKSFKLSARDTQLKQGFLKELRKTAYPRLKKVYGGVLYVKYLTSSPEFSTALKNLADKARASGLPSKDNKELLEELAELEHEQWMSWSKSIMQQIMGSAEEFGGRNLEKRVSEKHNALLNCWKPYAELSEDQKEKDRIWARKVIQAARNSAQKELDDLKAELKEMNYHYNAINGVMNETNKEMKRKDAEHQAQVRKLEKYKVFYDHIKAHFEKEHPDWKVECKICGRNIDEIFQSPKPTAAGGDLKEVKK